MSEATHWDDRWSRRPFKPANPFAKKAYGLIKTKNYKTLLDLGCGGGRDAIFFSKMGLRVTAVDFSESAIKKLKSQTDKIDCVLKDIRNLRFKDNTFDVIYAHSSLHYFDDQTTQTIFDQLSRMLKKGGLIFVKCKSTDDPLFGQGERVGENMYQKEHFRHFFTKEYMAEKLKRFKIIRIRRTSLIDSERKSAFVEAIATK